MDITRLRYTFVFLSKSHKVFKYVYTKHEHDIFNMSGDIHKNYIKLNLTSECQNFK